MKSKMKWSEVIDKLNNSPKGEAKLTLRMGSPGSAQVTRCRLLDEYNNLKASTKGPFLTLSLNA